MRLSPLDFLPLPHVGPAGVFTIPTTCGPTFLSQAPLLEPELLLVTTVMAAHYPTICPFLHLSQLLLLLLTALLFESALSLSRDSAWFTTPPS